MVQGQASVGGRQRGDGAGVECRLFLLGGFRVECRGVPIPDEAWVRPRAATIVKLLAIEPSHRLHRERIIDLLWPDSPAPAGAGNLRKLLHYARHALDDAADEGGATLLPASGDSLGLDTDRVWVDVDAFESAAQRALATAALDDLTLAAGLYAGELLPADRYEDWTEERREDLAALHREVLLALASSLAAEGRYDEAAGFLRSRLSTDPADEAAHRALMRLYAAQGDRQQALRQYRRCRRALAEHLDVEPSPETEALHRQIVAGGITIAPGTHSALPAAVVHTVDAALIARDRALELIGMNWGALAGSGSQAARIDRRAVVVIGGEAGVGKTRLAAEAARVAAKRGAVVLWGSASGLEGRVPYGPFAEALEEYVSGLPSGERDELASTQPELGRLLPSLQTGTPPAGDPKSEQMRLFAGIARLLASATRDRMLLFVIDDLHQADVASLQLLRYLARLAPDRGWLILGTYREEGLQVESSFHILLSELQRSGISRHVDLLPLGRGDSDRLVEALLEPEPVGSDVLHHVYALSQGNPLYVTELVAALREQGALVLHGGRWSLKASAVRSGLPRTITTLIATRVRSLGEETLRTLAVAAVAGMAFDPDLVTAAVEYEPDVAMGALDRAVEARLLEERDRAYVFAHPLIRETLYQALTGHQRARLHQALGRAIEDRGSLDLDALAYHFARSADTERAIVYLEKSADKAGDAYANEIAESHYRDLLAQLEPLNRPADLARVREKLGALLFRMARATEALAELDAASDLNRDLGDWEGLARVAALVGEVFGHQGRVEAGLRATNDVLSEVRDVVDGTSLGRLQVSRAGLFYIAGKHEAQLEASRRAIAALGTGGGREQTVLLARAYHLLGTAELSLTSIDAGRESLETARDLATQTGNLELLGRTYFSLAWASLLGGDLHGHVVHSRACLEVVQKTGASVVVAMARLRLGMAYFQVGDWQRARPLLDRAWDELSRLESPERRAQGMTIRAYVALGEGNLGRAREMLEEALELARRAHSAVATANAAFFLAEVYVAEGRPDLALACLEPLLCDVERAETRSLNLVRVAGGAASAHAELANTVEADRLSTMALDWARAAGSRFYLLEALYARGCALGAQERWEEAEEAFREALDLGRQMGFPWREAWVLGLWARVEERRGRAERARELAEEAAAILQQHGGDAAAIRLLAPVREQAH